MSVEELVSQAAEEVTAGGDWLSQCRSVIRDCAEPGKGYKLMCLGLGSLSELRNARIQFVFLQLVLQKALGVADDCVTIFDPVFTPGDAAYLRDQVGYVVLSAEPEDYTVGANTVAYMPHCDLTLFERFLGDNWSPRIIPNIILVGNNLSDYAESIPSQKFSTVYPCVANLVPHLHSWTIPAPDSLLPAFSSVSVQTIRDPALLPQRHDIFWSIPTQTDHSTERTGNTQIPKKADRAILERDKTEGEETGGWGKEKKRERMRKL